MINFNRAKDIEKRSGKPPLGIIKQPLLLKLAR